MLIVRYMVRMVGTDLLPWWIFSGEDIIVRGGLHLLYVRHLVSCQTHEKCFII